MSVSRVSWCATEAASEFAPMDTKKNVLRKRVVTNSEGRLRNQHLACVKSAEVWAGTKMSFWKR